MRGVDGDVMMHWEVLAVFEELKVVDDNFLDWRTVLHQAVIQHTVSAETSDGGRTHSFRGTTYFNRTIFLVCSNPGALSR